MILLVRQLSQWAIYAMMDTMTTIKSFTSKVKERELCCLKLISRISPKPKLRWLPRLLRLRDLPKRKKDGHSKRPKKQNALESKQKLPQKKKDSRPKKLKDWPEKPRNGLRKSA